MTDIKNIVIFALFGTSAFILNLGHIEAQRPIQLTQEVIATEISPLLTKTLFTEELNSDILEVSKLKTESAEEETKITQTIKNDKKPTNQKVEVFTVPFYSQFSDITSASWKKIGCGIASLAMLIEFHEPGATTVDNLLQEGIEADAYVSSAGWSHAGLIGLSKKYGLVGSSRDMAGLTMDSAFSELEEVLEKGPVMVSVHYTFDPKNPIPHLVVINGVSDGKVFYNDPAESVGGGSISIRKFQSAWKKRYIEIHSA